MTMNKQHNKDWEEGFEAGAKAEREKIREKWESLNIVGVACAGLAQGVIVRNPWGETDSMQVDRQSYKQFIDSMRGEK